MDDDNNNMSTTEHSVWIEFSSTASSHKGGAQLARLMHEIMTDKKSMLLKELHDDEEADITFPSDETWRDTIYRKLLERQRRGKMEEELPLKEEDAVLHDWNIAAPKTKKVALCVPNAARLGKNDLLSGVGPITWTVSDISKAGRLLCIPPMATTFSDEQEMRRVYTLIYDVYRYKNILGQALDDIGFFNEHPYLSKAISRVWLLLYDLYHRGFKKRTLRNAAIADTCFPNSGLQEVEDTLLKDRIRLAASVARLRIKHQALRLSQMLPHHLRDEKVCCQARNAPVTCWINLKKVKNLEDLSNTIQKVLNLHLIEESGTVNADGFKYDIHCPHFIIFHPSMRTKLAQSSLVQKHKLVVQDKSFCLGPATFDRIISDLQLTGTVIQSHVNSPRTTAYLASLLSQNDNIKKLLAFSAGSRKEEYETYFNELGIKNILIFSEKLIDLPTDSSNLEEVIAVFATPPNSYSAVADPIDLVCSRGGDLSMLEVLTETEDTPEGRKRVAGILDEQKRTLKYAMSRPQIQFVLYETHSEIDSENDFMVLKAMNEINKSARLHHAVIQGKLKQSQFLEQANAMEVNNNDETIVTPFNVEKMKSLSDVVVPDCDVFGTPQLPELCDNIDCAKLAKESCFLALLQRKQITRMDNKYMIQMAEARGLFGSDVSTAKKKVKKKIERVITSPSIKPRKRTKDIEIGRIAASTLSSRLHTSSDSKCHKGCSPRPQVSQPRRWWSETTRHITNLRTSLSRQKVIPPLDVSGEGERGACDGKANVKRFVNHLVRRSQKVDEIVAKSSTNVGTVPLYPRLRLTRPSKTLETKVPVPVHITLVTFPPYPAAYS